MNKENVELIQDLEKRRSNAVRALKQTQDRVETPGGIHWPQRLQLLLQQPVNPPSTAEDITPEFIEYAENFTQMVNGVKILREQRVPQLQERIRQIDAERYSQVRSSFLEALKYFKKRDGQELPGLRKEILEKAQAVRDRLEKELAPAMPATGNIEFAVDPDKNPSSGKTKNKKAREKKGKIFNLAEGVETPGLIGRQAQVMEILLRDPSRKVHKDILTEAIWGNLSREDGLNNLSNTKGYLNPLLRKLGYEITKVGWRDSAHYALVSYNRELPMQRRVRQESSIIHGRIEKTNVTTSSSTPQPQEGEKI